MEWDVLGGLETNALCNMCSLFVMRTAGTPTKLTSSGFNQLFLFIGLSGTGSTDDVLTIVFKQNTNNTISAIWNKGSITLSISDQTSYLNVSSSNSNITCMVLSNFPFTVG